ncbi:MAG: hypothetical protein EA352_12790 [Gemmatimonadales bacterium]|nr:MAG: hypothetical protein EA352_12790 [Gemmatimonadales bacterium]
MSEETRETASKVLELLEEACRRERGQARWYRAMAARAAMDVEDGDAPAALVDRLNDLHADEQHHLSRLAARLLELGGTPPLDGGERPALPGDDWREVWEAEARRREAAEVAWYVGVLEEDWSDDRTRAVLQEILEGERNQARDLSGKWMSA